MKSSSMPSARAPSAIRAARGPTVTRKSIGSRATSSPIRKWASSVSEPSSAMSPSTAILWRALRISASVSIAARMDVGFALYASLMTSTPERGLERLHAHRTRLSVPQSRDDRIGLDTDFKSDRRRRECVVDVVPTRQAQTRLQRPISPDEPERGQALLIHDSTSSARTSQPVARPYVVTAGDATCRPARSYDASSPLRKTRPSAGIASTSSPLASAIASCCRAARCGSSPHS